MTERAKGHVGGTTVLGGHNKASTDTRKLVKRAERNVWNRLLSIIKDADWVSYFCKKKLDDRWPVVANLRCGAWYVPPLSKSEVVRGCYFKSTDGHTHEWSFSLKRYNLDLLQFIQEQGGCIIVDSTRRGKSMPDALSKTVPIWCAVINAAVQRKYGSTSSFTAESTRLRTPQHVVGASEHAQIESKIDFWAEELLQSDLALPRLAKPLRPLFVSRQHYEETLDELQQLKESSELPYHPVVLLSASKMVPTPSLDPQADHFDEGISLSLPDDIRADIRSASFVYVQGSGDDEEAWAQGLKPQHFWQHDTLRALLASNGEEEKISTVIRENIVQDKLASMHIEHDVDDSRQEFHNSADLQIGSLPLWLGRRDDRQIISLDEETQYGAVLHLDGQLPSEGHVDADGDYNAFETAKIRMLGIERGKRGLNTFRAAIAPCLSLARSTLPQPILLCSAEEGVGGDLRIGIAVCILAACFDANQQLLPHLVDQNTLTLTKDDVRRRLQWIASAVPSAKPPSRAHMLRINEVLLSESYRPKSAKIS